MHSNDRHKLTIINHRNQKSFNVAIMRYKNFSIYVQRQIDKLLRVYQKFVKTYVDDIVIFSRTLKKHLSHFRQIFEKLINVNVSIKLIKTFIDYSSVQLLNQKIDFFELSISEKKLRTIAKLQFSRTLRQLKTYLNLINWMRKYVSFYADVFKFLQKRKTILLKSTSKKNNARKTFANRIKIENRTSKKIISYKMLQSLLFAFIYLTHHDSRRQTFVNFDTNKKFDINAVVYHVKKNFCQFDEYLFKSTIQSIMFLSRLLNSIETRYWSTKIKIVEIVWILRKIRHFIKFVALFIIIYTDHETALSIIKQTTFTSSFTNKLNLRLMCVSNYIQRFDLNIRHKSNRTHIVSNALFKLINLNTFELFTKKKLNVLFILTDVDISHSKINVFFTCSLIKINVVFRQKILNDYKAELD